MFEIKDSKDRLFLLQTDFERLQRQPLDISLAEKACSDAWHLSDWVLHEMNESGNNVTKEAFRVNLFKECPEMRILHDLANTIKHKVLTNPKVEIKATNIKQDPSFRFVHSITLAQISCLAFLLRMRIFRPRYRRMTGQGTKRIPRPAKIELAMPAPKYS